MPFSPLSRTLLAATLVAGLGLSVPAHAQTKPAKLATCAACHGEQGKSILPNYPNLAGQHRSFLEQALKAFRTTRNKNAVMNAQAKDLSDKEIEELAAWYSSRPALVYVPTVDPGTGTLN